MIELTNEEVVKALECCSSPNVLKGCENCPLRNNKENCRSILDFKILNLINDQKTEIERLTEEINALNGNTEKYIAECEKRSREMAEDYRKEIRVEAIKEFAKIVKAEAFDRCIDVTYDGRGEVKRIGIRRVLFNKQINELVKEMEKNQDE